MFQGLRGWRGPGQEMGPGSLERGQAPGLLNTGEEVSKRPQTVLRRAEPQRRVGSRRELDVKVRMAGLHQGSRACRGTQAEVPGFPPSRRTTATIRQTPFASVSPTPTALSSTHPGGGARGQG